MDSSLQSFEQQQDFVVVENQFHQVITEIKASFPIWDEFIFKTGKLQASIKSMVYVLGSFLETFQKLADIASGTKGGYSNEMGIGLTRLNLRQRGIEDKLKSLINSLSESLVIPTQEKLDEWRKSIIILDKDHKNESKRAQQDLKKASAEATKLKKKVKKVIKPEVQKQLDTAMFDHQSKTQTLDLIQRTFLRSAVGFSRGQFCHLVACFRPVVDIQLSMMTDLSSIQDTMDVLIAQSFCPPPPPSSTSSNPQYPQSQQHHHTTPPSPDTSKGSYQDLFPGKPPMQSNPSDSRKSSLSSSSSVPNNPVISPQHQTGGQSSDKDSTALLAMRKEPHQHHHHHLSCSSYESMKLQPQQCSHGHHHHHHCHHHSSPTPPVIPSPSSSSSTSPPPPPPLLLPASTSPSSLPTSPSRTASLKTSAVTLPSPPPECTCGIITTAIKSTNPYALPLYIGDRGGNEGGGNTTKGYTRLQFLDDVDSNLVKDGSSPLGKSESESTTAPTTAAATTATTTATTTNPALELSLIKGQNMTLEGYVKMNQLASYYASQQQQGNGNLHLSLKKDLSSIFPQHLLSQSLKSAAELMLTKTSKTAEDVLDIARKDPIVTSVQQQHHHHQQQQQKPQQQQQQRRSNLRDRSLPPSNRKNMRVQFVHQISSPSPSTPPEQRTIQGNGSPTSGVVTQVQQQQQPKKGSAICKSPSMSRVVDCMSSSVTSLPPLPPPEMLKQSWSHSVTSKTCFDDSHVDELPLPPPPEELS